MAALCCKTLQHMLEGKIPASLGKLESLQILNLANNSFSGLVPTELSLSLMYLNLQENKLEGEIPIELNKLHQLQMLDLSNNNLSEAIELLNTELKNLESLVLSDNFLTDSIPRNLCISNSKLHQLFLA